MATKLKGMPVEATPGRGCFDHLQLRRADGGSLGQSALESRPGTDFAREPDVVHVSHRRAVDRHERGDHHLHARLWPDAAGHELVAGARHHPARQRHCPRPDDPERPRRDEIRRVLSSAVPRGLRRERRQRARRAARDCGVRVVWHSDVDWRAGARNTADRGVAGLGQRAGQHLDLVRVCSGSHKSQSSFAASRASSYSKRGRRRCCSVAAACCCGGRSPTAAGSSASCPSRRSCSRAVRHSGRCSRQH